MFFFLFCDRGGHRGQGRIQLRFCTVISFACLRFCRLCIPAVLIDEALFGESLDQRLGISAMLLEFLLMIRLVLGQCSYELGPFLLRPGARLVAVLPRGHANGDCRGRSR